MTKRRLAGLVLAAAIASLAVLAAGCGGGGDEGGGEAAPPATESAPADTGTAGGGETTPAETGAPSEPQGTGEPGGTYRVGVEAAFDFTDAFDPTGEYTAVGWSFYRQLLLRTLLTYKGLAGDEGNEVVPDLATDLPEVSEDGLTYTFTLKDGIMFGPPVNREITSQDILYAAERLANPDLGGAGYPNYYAGTIEGFTEFSEGKADTISGIETPDDKTIVFHLTKPTGDFTHRIAMPAMAPIPEEVAKCFTAPGDYGRYVIASGPYMIEGSDALDASSCDTMQPIAGYDPEQHLLLVRNPNYDPATDDPAVRPALPDRFEFLINSNTDDIFNRVKEGSLDESLAGETPKIIQEYTSNEDLQDNLKLNPDDSVFYLSMNLTTPPLDDIHVRKAANLVMDKTGLIASWGGPTIGDVATHIMPPSMAPDLGQEYDPYPSADFRGDVEAAKAEMAQSKYDTDGDGLCDAPECNDVLLVMGTEARDNGMAPIFTDSLAKIGIKVKLRQTPDQYSVVLDPKTQTPLAGSVGWGKDYPDAFTFFLYLFYGPSISSPVTYNEPLVGLTAEKAKDIGIPVPDPLPPSVDADIDACGELAEEARLQCWEDLDKKVMEEVVPWVPYIWRKQSTTISDAVTQWSFDQSTGNTAWSHVAVDQSAQG